MKIRGWLFAAAMVLSAQCAFAASVTDTQGIDDALSSPTGETAVITEQEQAAVVADVIATAGLDSAVAQTQLVASSSGTLLSAVMGGSLDANVNDGIVAMWDAVKVGDTGAASALSGTVATAAVDAGSATTAAIGGGGGVIAGRQSGLMAERKAMGNVDSALASFKMNQNFANRLWASPFYTRQQMDEKDGYNGYDYSAYGASVGYDHVFGSFVAGGAFTYSRGDFDADELVDDNTIDNYSFSLYGQYYSTDTGFFATLAGGYSLGQNDGSYDVNGGRFSSEFDTDSYWFGANIGKDFFLGENWTVTPSIGLFWSESESENYTENGVAIGGGANPVAFRRFSEINSEALMLPIDLKVEYTTMLDSCSSLSFNVAGGYAYNFRSDSGRAEGSYQFVGSNATVLMQGAEAGKSSWNIGAGITYRRNNFDIGLNYRYDGKKKFDGHRVAATIGWNF